MSITMILLKDKRYIVWSVQVSLSGLELIMNSHLVTSYYNVHTLPLFLSYSPLKTKQLFLIQLGSISPVLKRIVSEAPILQKIYWNKSKKLRSNVILNN